MNELTERQCSKCHQWKPEAAVESVKVDPGDPGVFARRVYVCLDCLGRPDSSESSLNEDQILKASGRELAGLVGQHVMGYKRFESWEAWERAGTPVESIVLDVPEGMEPTSDAQYRVFGKRGGGIEYRPHMNMNAAMEVVKKLADRGWDIHMLVRPEWIKVDLMLLATGPGASYPQRVLAPVKVDIYEELPTALCRAALLTVLEGDVHELD